MDGCKYCLQSFEHAPDCPVLEAAKLRAQLAEVKAELAIMKQDYLGAMNCCEQLTKVKMECSGMGKVLSSGIVVKTEEYSALILAQSELGLLKQILRKVVDSEAIKEAPFFNYSEAVLSAKEFLAGAEPKSRAFEGKE